MVRQWIKEFMFWRFALTLRFCLGRRFTAFDTGGGEMSEGDNEQIAFETGQSLKRRKRRCYDRSRSAGSAADWKSG